MAMSENAGGGRRSPFPGMDPYLEAPELWPDVHTRLMNVFSEQLAPLLAPGYVAELHPRMVIEQVGGPGEDEVILPDVAVVEATRSGGGGYGAMTVEALAPAPVQLRVPLEVPVELISIHIRHLQDRRVVTVIELLSPVNKRPGKGREEYLEKRQEVLKSKVHLVEIDLLRRWPRMPFQERVPAADYIIMVSRRERRPVCDVWPIWVRQQLPVIPIPLLRPDPDVVLDMGAALQTAYQRARYDLRIDYRQPPTPPLSEADAEWAAALIGRGANGG
jgi:hypothetical protein